MNKALFFERPNLHLALAQIAQRNQIFGIFGGKGVGKSSLVKNWLMSKGNPEIAESTPKIKWVNCQLGVSLHSKLGISDSLSLEEALDNFAQSWKKFDWIIWDDIHLLSKNQLMTLVLFAKNSFYAPPQIFISDEEIPELTGEIGILSCPPFSREETKNFIEDFLNVNKPYELEQAFVSTRGLPFLLQVWAQNNQQLSPSALSSLLSDEEIEKLFYLHFSERLPMTLNPEFLPLVRKGFISQENDYYFVEASFVEWINQSFYSKQKNKAAKNVFNKLSSQSDHFRAVLIAVEAELSEECVLASQFISPLLIERFPSQKLKVFHNLLMKNIEFENLKNENAHILRLVLKSGVLLGFRSELLKRFRVTIQELENFDSYTDELLYFSHELIYFFNRSSGETEIVSKLLQRVQSLVKGSLRYLIQIEHAFVFVQSDPARSLKTLLRIIEECQREKSETLYTIQGNAAVQCAHSYSNLGEFQKARDYYLLAEQFYERSHEIYYSCISRLNLIFNYLNDEEIDKAQIMINELRESSLRFGYAYILSGLMYAEAQVVALRLQPHMALQIIENALSQLPKGTPPRALIDILCLKIELLNRLGKHEEAHAIYQQQSTLHQFPIVRILFDDLSLDESLELLNQKQTILSPVYSQFLKNILNSQLDQQSIENQSKTPLRQWFNLEYQLKKCSKKDRDSLLRISASMNLLLKKTDELIPEKIAANLLSLQLEFIENSPDHHTDTTEVEKLLLDWIADESVKRPFYLILENLKSKELVLNAKEWNSLHPVDRLRWQEWLLPRRKVSKDSYLIKTLKGQKELAKIDPNLHLKYDLTLIEHLGQVHFFQKEILEFHRKSVLRNLLSLIIEFYPKELVKSQLALSIWGEAYSPMIHDARIYTSIQRLRTLLKSRKFKQEVIESWESGYRLNPSVSFAHIKPESADLDNLDKIQILILKALNLRSKGTDPWVSRADLVELTQSSDSTIKRELAKLILALRVIRKGDGPSVVYALNEAQ